MMLNWHLRECVLQRWAQQPRLIVHAVLLHARKCSHPERQSLLKDLLPAPRHVHAGASTPSPSSAMIQVLWLL